MLILFSPSKTQTPTALPAATTKPHFIHDAKMLMDTLRSLPQEEMQQILQLSTPLFQKTLPVVSSWGTMNDSSSSAALALFTGDAFSTLDAPTLSPAAWEYAQESLCLLSGLYGVVRPLDTLHPHRLEMATTLPAVGNLTSYWRPLLTTYLQKMIASHNEKTILNIASGEYSSALDFKSLAATVITPEFKEESQGKLSTISIFAKRARGAALRFILENQLTTPEDLKSFRWEGYTFDPLASTTKKWVFIRPR